jgi:hypothetical protein
MIRKRYEGLDKKTQAYMDHVLMRVPSKKVKSKIPARRSDESAQAIYLELESEETWVKSINQFSLGENEN